MNVTLLLAVLLQATSWSYTLLDIDGKTVFDADGVKIIFQGSGTRGGRASGTIQLSGDGRTSGGVGSGDTAFTKEYAAGVTKLTYKGHVFTLTDGGKSLAYGNQSFDLGKGKITIIVNPTGPAEIQKTN